MRVGKSGMWDGGRHWPAIGPAAGSGLPVHLPTTHLPTLNTHQSTIGFDKMKQKIRVAT